MVNRLFVYHAEGTGSFPAASRSTMGGSTKVHRFTFSCGSSKTPSLVKSVADDSSTAP